MEEMPRRKTSAELCAGRIKPIKFCKRCKVKYCPPRYSSSAALGLCWKCRKFYYAEWYQQRKKPYLARLSPLARKEYDRKQYAAWKKWVAKHGVRRKKQALESYHRHKDEHRQRRHRATKGQAN